MINVFQRKISLSRLDIFWVACSGYCEGLLNKWWVSSWNTQALGMQWETWVVELLLSSLQEVGRDVWCSPRKIPALKWLYHIHVQCRGCYYKFYYLFISILPPPPCVDEPGGVMDLWIYTCGCGHTYAHPSGSVCDTCVHSCASACEYILAIFWPKFAHLCAYGCVCVGAFCQQEKTHIRRAACVYAGVCHMC